MNQKIPANLSVWKILIGITLLWAQESLLSNVYSSEAEKNRPNIIYIISDDQSWTDYSFMGHPYIQTPHIDKLSRESLLFKNGYVTTSLCSPSLATIITGLYPSQHKITGNEPPSPLDENGKRIPRSKAFFEGRIEMDEIIRNTDTLPKMLRKMGYRSFQTGKWWHGGYDLAGFDGGMTHGDPSRGGRHGDVGLEIGRKGLKPIYDFIESDSDQPFFIWYAPFLPHTPHNPPARLLEKYSDSAPSPSIAKYWAMCEWFDETCGDLLKYLDEKGLRDDTVIMYVTDNGWINQKNSSRYAPKSKRSPYDGGLRTPIMVNWRGKIKPTVSPSLASSIDLVPTTLKLLGAEQPARLKGINLLDETLRKNRETIFGAVYLHDAKSIHKPKENLTHWWARNDQWKLIIQGNRNNSNSRSGIELYNLHTDPMETVNLASQETLGVVQELTSSILSWWGDTYLE